MDEQNPPITELNDDRVAKWVERFRVRNADKKHPAMDSIHGNTVNSLQPRKRFSFVIDEAAIFTDLRDRSA